MLALAQRDADSEARWLTGIGFYARASNAGGRRERKLASSVACSCVWGLDGYRLPSPSPRVLVNTAAAARVPPVHVLPSLGAGYTPRSWASAPLRRRVAGIARGRQRGVPQRHNRAGCSPRSDTPAHHVNRPCVAQPPLRLVRFPLGFRIASLRLRQRRSRAPPPLLSLKRAQRWSERRSTLERRRQTCSGPPAAAGHARHLAGLLRVPVKRMEDLRWFDVAAVAPLDSTAWSKACATWIGQLPPTPCPLPPRLAGQAAHRARRRTSAWQARAHQRHNFGRHLAGPVACGTLACRGQPPGGDRRRAKFPYGRGRNCGTVFGSLAHVAWSCPARPPPIPKLVTNGPFGWPQACYHDCLDALDRLAAVRRHILDRFYDRPPRNGEAQC